MFFFLMAAIPKFWVKKNGKKVKILEHYYKFEWNLFMISLYIKLRLGCSSCKRNTVCICWCFVVTSKRIIRERWNTFCFEHYCRAGELQFYIQNTVRFVNDFQNIWADWISWRLDHRHFSKLQFSCIRSATSLPRCVRDLARWFYEVVYLNLCR